MVDLGEASVAIASLSDLVAMKQAMGRPKDQREVHVLLAAADERGIRLGPPDDPTRDDDPG